MVVAGGAVPHIDSALFHMDVSGSTYVAPQVLTNVTNQMQVMQEEVFGPVCCVVKVPLTKLY